MGSHEKQQQQQPYQQQHQQQPQQLGRSMQGAQFYPANSAMMDRGTSSRSGMDLEWSSPQQSSSAQQRPGSQRNDEIHSGTGFEQMGFAGGSNGFFGVPGADTDAELEAILSNYQPKVNAPARLPAEQLLQDGRRMSTTRSSQPAADNLDPATAAAAAAAAAYGHLGYGGVGGTGHGRAVANWSAVPLNSSGPPQGTGGGGGGGGAANLNPFGIGSQPYTDASSISNRVSSQPDVSPLVQVNRVFGTGGGGGGGSGAGAGGGYEGDASNSNTSSAHTPAEMSSGTDDNGSGKRRRVTMSAGESLPGLHAGSLENLSPESSFRQQQQLQQQRQFQIEQPQQQQQPYLDQSHAATSLNTFSGGPMHGLSTHRPNFNHHASSTVNSALMEEMAAAGLRRASEDNKRVFNHGPGALANHSHLHNQSEFSSSASPPPMSSLLTTNNSGHPARPPYRHRRSHSGSAAISSSGSFFGHTGGNDDGASGNRLGLSNAKRLSHGSSTFGLGGGGSGSQMAGHAASHPPGLGSQVLRGADGTASGTNAATDFTKRKGWSNRIVEELLDFVHVLDAQGRLLFATPSVQTLTGWRPEELKGRTLSDFIHPDDVSAVMRELNTAMQERSELTMFYRFRKRPQSAADKQRIQEKREANHVDLSQSESSGTDSSSAQKTGIESGTNGLMRRPSLRNQDQDDDEEAGSFLDDHEDKYVIFEATGHPYFPPDGAGGVSLAESTGEANDGGSIQSVKLESGSPMKQRTTKTSIDDNMQEINGRRGSEEEFKSQSAMQCFFCTCRVYPTKNVGMLDSFLELKLENERLRMLLSELSVSETPTHPLKQQHTGGAASSTEAGSEGRRSLDEGAHAYNPDYQSFDADGTPHFPSYAQMQSFHGRDSISSIQHLPSAPTSPIVGQTLERSMTKDTTGAEESDDARSPASGAADEDGKRKKKKPKPEEGDYVCTDCGRVDSPEWRKGPLGPKTLCNACGLRWAKKVKRSGGDPNAIAMAAKPTKGQIKAQAAAARAQKQNQQFQAENADLTATGPPPTNATGGHSDEAASPTFTNTPHSSTFPQSSAWDHNAWPPASMHGIQQHGPQSQNLGEGGTNQASHFMGQPFDSNAFHMG